MTETKTIEYTSGKALMALGPERLHQHLSTRMETALGKAMHQMEVRFRDVSISATSSHSLGKYVGLSSESKTKTILKDVSGVFKPGSMTLVLGQPGSGKSSLMQLLSGRLPESKGVRIDGDVTYNGALRSEIKKRLPQFVSYVTQRDHHFPTLTVKETLKFAHECSGGLEFSQRLEPLLSKATPEENKAAHDAIRSLHEHFPDVVIQQLGMEHCQDTMVGDAMLRGISGGERKRVTTGEMQFGSTVVLMMDEISTGLDSAATYDIIKMERSIAKNLRKTVVIALLQPPSEVFDLFDDVMLLNDGYVVYHGPREKAIDYFTDMGFVRPSHRDVADYLLDLGTDQQRQYEVARADGSAPPRTASEFASIFRKSSIHDEMIAYLEDPHDPVLLKDMDELLHLVPEFHQSFFASTKTLVKRDLTRMSRNMGFYKTHFFNMLMVALLNASVFWQFDPSNPQASLGVLQQFLVLLALMQTAQIPGFLSARAVFYRQRRANFYRSSSYTLGYLLCHLPAALGEAIVLGTTAYWMCGFVASASGFFIFLLVLFLHSTVFMIMCFALSALVSNVHIAKPVAMMGVVTSAVFCGFLITKDQIPDYLIWIFWLNPSAYALRTMVVNQYSNSEFDVCEYGGIDYCEKYGMQMGEYTLRLFAVDSAKGWVWYGIIYIIAVIVVFAWLSSLILEHYRYESTNSPSKGEGKMTKASGFDSTDSYGLVQTPRGGDTKLDIHPDSHRYRIPPITLAFRDLWYSVPDPANPKLELKLLKGISGFARPGTMTALMGSSGAGKTTLMDVIAGRKTGGSIQGEILLNGHPASALAIHRATGYCEQMDIHSEASTFREALTFSAFLRQSSDVLASLKYQSVEECLDILDLHSIADKTIRGSSLEQMKRLTIGVELAAQPSVLFLDEPTSGLDARSAKLVMDGVRKVANSGRTVVCTIHQPSTEVFMLFDSLLLLKRGGETVFFGDLGECGRYLVEYLEAVLCVTPIQDGDNPATWMLESIGAGVGNTTTQNTDFASVFQTSENARRMDEDLRTPGIGRPVPGESPIAFTSKRAASSWTQATLVTQRFMALYWRSPAYNITRLIIIFFIALLAGLSFLKVEYDSYQGINSGAGMIFMTTFFTGATTYHSVIAFMSVERPSYYRERASQTYNALWYFVGATVAEIPSIFGGMLVFTAVYFPMVGFSGAGSFFFYWVTLSVHVLTMAYVGQFLAFACSTIEIAVVVSVLINTIFIQVMGFNPTAREIPTAYRWLYQINPSSFSFAVASGIAFGDCPSADSSAIGCQKLSNLPISLPSDLTVKEYFELVFNVKHSDLGLNFLYMIVTMVVVRLFALMALRYVNYQRK